MPIQIALHTPEIDATNRDGLGFGLDSEGLLSTADGLRSLQRFRVRGASRRAVEEILRMGMAALSECQAEPSSDQQRGAYTQYPNLGHHHLDGRGLFPKLKPAEPLRRGAKFLDELLGGLGSEQDGQTLSGLSGGDAGKLGADLQRLFAQLQQVSAVFSGDTPLSAEAQGQLSRWSELTIAELKTLCSKIQGDLDLSKPHVHLTVDQRGRWQGGVLRMAGLPTLWIRSCVREGGTGESKASGVFPEGFAPLFLENLIGQMGGLEAMNGRDGEGGLSPEWQARVVSPVLGLKWKRDAEPSVATPPRIKRGPAAPPSPRRPQQPQRPQQSRPQRPVGAVAVPKPQAPPSGASRAPFRPPSSPPSRPAGRAGRGNFDRIFTQPSAFAKPAAVAQPSALEMKRRRDEERKRLDAEHAQGLLAQARQAHEKGKKDEAVKFADGALFRFAQAGDIGGARDVRALLAELGVEE
ncbi:MAG: hypothetical protein Q8P95_05270 [bacterium]|nr:hypothetical protein [bacterium]